MLHTPRAGIEPLFEGRDSRFCSRPHIRSRTLLAARTYDPSMEQPSLLFTLRVAGEKRGFTVVFEPLGSEYELKPGDALLVHVYGSSAGHDNPDADIEVIRTDEALTLWLWSGEYRVWDKAGTELKQL